ncbi:gamma-glutamylcyclotransferase [Saccharospirillum impatiens]|uniref:gamma-glutamylcyclotransferase n=1 Tax=Saccharospirillum impatiens TaxID=169438 RepID=UPI00041FCF76|nr:gamma-glutamylcyclotransferase [Saccharospirillum impatiens]
MTKDPFSHHPELAELITRPEDSFFRDFSITKLANILIDRGLPTGWWHTDEHRNAIREEALAEHRSEDLWVFAYGSLMWDPAIQFTEVRRARVEGYQRRFILKDIHGARGTREAPGLMAALDAGGECEGLAFRINREAIERETDILWCREFIGPAYFPVFVSAQIGEDTVDALTFVADYDAELIEPELSRTEQLDYLANGSGFLGFSADYLRNIARQFRLLGIEDDEVEELLRELNLLEQ